ncbi:hypothetical protein VNO77_10322 [Canavalia gladiata]|uniref:RING-type E3 ubiquitin transferase n=1 Tax=Canavalia gladiata TaxID=3824 RepID=A0AAN9MAW0_CANGL
MASTPFIFSWNVICAPFDEAELENNLFFQQEHHGDYFNIKVNVKHQLCFTQLQPPQPPSIVPFDGCSIQFSMFLASQEFLENGGSHMLLHFPDSIIPNELIHTMMPDVINYAKAAVQSCRRGFHYESPNFRLVTLVLDIFVQKLYDELDDSIIDMIMMEFPEEVQMVPASNTAIESLTKVKLESSAMKERCSICLTEFDKDMEVSLMPCKHVYHQECLIKWLKTSHMCPLCRCPLPTSSTD